MSTAYSSAIEALRVEIAQKESELAPLRQQLAAKEAEIAPLKTTANFLLKKAGLPEEFTVGPSAGVGGDEPKLVIRPSQFFNKEASEAAVEYLSLKYAAAGSKEPTPALVDEIYAALVSGHYKFTGTSDTNNKNALKTALSRNTAQVAKISDGLYGLRKWYGMRASRKSSSDTTTPEEIFGDEPDPRTGEAANSAPQAGGGK